MSQYEVKAAIRRAVEKILRFPNSHPPSEWEIDRAADIIATELSVHQPDVQAADVRSELFLLLRRMSELTLDEGFSGHHQNGFEMFRTQAEAVIKSRLAASPVQPEEWVTCADCGQKRALSSLESRDTFVCRYCLSTKAVQVDEVSKEQ